MSSPTDPTLSLPEGDDLEVPAVLASAQALDQQFGYAGLDNVRRAKIAVRAYLEAARPADPAAEAGVAEEAS